MRDLNNKIDNAGATADGKLPSIEWNEIASEIQSLIESTSQSLTSSDLLQVVKGISTYCTTGDFYTGAGVVNAYTATVISPMIAPDSVAVGMKIRAIIPITNTGNATLNAFSSGAIDIGHPGGAGVNNGELIASTEYEFIYRISPSIHWEVIGAEVAPAGVPTGSIILTASAAVPTGFFECNDAAVSRTTYSALFAVIGEVYGSGDGISTFNVPDLRGLFVRGWDHGAGNDPDAATRTGGDIVGSSQTDELKSHTHLSEVNPTPTLGAGTQGQQVGGIATIANITATGGAETRPANIAMMYIIKH